MYLDVLQFQGFFDFQILSNFKNVTDNIFGRVSEFPQVS